MNFETILAPHVNANDLDMIVVQWLVKPWQRVTKGQTICEVETTKAVVPVETACEGYVYPLVAKGHKARVGEPLAHCFLTDDPRQLEQLNASSEVDSSTVVTKKARELMTQFGLSVADFPRFTSITSDTVIARVRELKGAVREFDSESTGRIVNGLSILADSVALVGSDFNQVLLALDAFQAGAPHHAIACISSTAASQEYEGIPILHEKALPLLKEKGLRYVCSVEADLETKKRHIEECQALGFDFISVIHPSAVIAKTSRLGKGLFIGALCVVGPEVTVGDFTRILCGATIAHHSTVGTHVSISDGSVLGGNVTVGDMTLIGLGVNVNKRVTIGAGVTVVSGATVIDNVSEATIVRL